MTFGGVAGSMGGGNIGTIGVNIVASTAGLEAGLSRSAALVGQFGNKMNQVGRNLTKYVSVPIAAVGAASIGMALRFEKSMTDVEALVGMSGKEVEKFKQQILDLAPAVGKSPQELGEAFYFIASSGLKGESAMRALKASATAAAAGLGDVQTVADAVTSAMNAYGESELSAVEATDVLTAAVREGKSEPEEFAAAIGMVIPIAQVMGVSFGEVAGTMAAMSLNGTNASEAVTQISAGLAQAIKPTKEGRERLATLGMTYDDLRESISEKGLQQTFRDLSTAFGGNIEKIGEVFGNIRALRGELTLTGPAAEKYAGIIERVSNAHGDAAKAAEVALSKPGAKLQKAWAGIQASLIELGDIMLPVVADVADGISGIVESFTELDEGVKKQIVQWGLLLAVVGPVLLIGSKLISWAIAFNTAMRTLSMTMGAVKAAFAAGGIVKGLGSLLTAIGPAGWIALGVTAVAGLAYGVYKLSKAFDDSYASAEQMQHAIDDIEVKPELAKWADTALGGHVVVEEGEIVWQPKVDTVLPDYAKGKGSKLVDWIKTEREMARQETIKQNLLDQQEQANAGAEAIRLDAEAQKSRWLAASGGGDHGPRGLSEDQQASYDAAIAEAERLAGVADGINAKMEGLADKRFVIKVDAEIKDMTRELHEAEATIKKLTGKKHKTSMDYTKIAEATRKAEILRGEIKRTTDANWPILIVFKQEQAQKKLNKLKADLEAFKNLKNITPQVRADGIKDFETRIEKQTDRVEELDSMSAAPRVSAPGAVDAMLDLDGAYGAWMTLYNSPSETKKTVTTEYRKEGGGQHGAIASGPTSGYTYLLHGTEAIVPLDPKEKSNARKILAQAGLLKETVLDQPAPKVGFRSSERLLQVEADSAARMKDVVQGALRASQARIDRPLDSASFARLRAMAAQPKVEPSDGGLSRLAQVVARTPAPARGGEPEPEREPSQVHYHNHMTLPQGLVVSDEERFGRTMQPYIERGTVLVEKRRKRGKASF